MSSAPTPSVMSSAQAVMKFIYEGTQLPPVLAQYVGFFTGLVTGALGGFALHGYFQRNKDDKAKVKLAILHILRVIQDDYSYFAMLQDPLKLLLHIETEVMRLVDKHLTQKEATQVTKGVKRSFSKIPNVSFDEVAHKRVREDYRDDVKERQEPAFAFVHQKQLRGFLDPPESELPRQEYVPGPWTTSKAIYQSPFETAGHSDSLPEEPDEDLGLEEDLMDIDEVTASSPGIPSVPGHLFGSSSRPAARLPISSSAQVTGGLQELIGIKPTRHAPELGSFGLDYEDLDLYSDEEEDLQPSGPPPTVRRCRGVKCSSTQLSPISASPWPAEDHPAVIAIKGWSTEAELEFSSSESERDDSPLTSFGVNISTVPEPEFSSSPVAPIEPAVANAVQEGIFASVESAGSPQTSSPETPSPSRKRKSASPSPTSPSKRVRFSPSPLVDITDVSPTPSCRASASTSRRRSPLRKGRRYGLSRPFHIEEAERAEAEQAEAEQAEAEQAELKTPPKKAMKATAKTPATATRKSSRIEQQKKKQDE